jgi:hypothetical protein
MESNGAYIEVDENNSRRVMVLTPHQESLDLVLAEINAMNAASEVGNTSKGMGSQ